MISNHLGRRVHDLLDGRMSREQTYAAMAHLAECTACSQAWHELRAAREALNSSEAGIDMSFARQLLDRERIAEIAASRPHSNLKVSRGRYRVPIVAAVSAMALLAATLSSAYVMGAPQRVSLEFASSSSHGNAQTVAYHGPDNMRSESHLRSWIHPDWAQSGLVPIEAKVVHDSNGQPVMVASIVADMHPVVVTEQHGRLDEDTKRSLPSRTVGDTTVFVANVYPPHMVWETGDVVISARCECPVTVLESVAAAFPVDSEPGIVDRISTGLNEMADMVRGE